MVKIEIPFCILIFCMTKQLTCIRHICMSKLHHDSNSLIFHLNKPCKTWIPKITNELWHYTLKNKVIIKLSPRIISKKPKFVKFPGGMEIIINLIENWKISHKFLSALLVTNKVSILLPTYIFTYICMDTIKLHELNAWLNLIARS